ncbi:hypothetical protein [Rhodohalobacter sp.]|uniref:hypothetical protein n=1 Tax=Rhodohalobacter sp. TaxID=1974210 RepID=UPI002ACE550F|nr:hypothetical protein [Rhodohalobacter sp.]MDZ7757392.1 hypothetical protein [Rhodohalobacter sp.]
MKSAPRKTSELLYYPVMEFTDQPGLSSTLQTKLAQEENFTKWVKAYLFATIHLIDVYQS